MTECSNPYTSCLSGLSCEVTSPPSSVHTPSPRPTSSASKAEALFSTPVKDIACAPKPTISPACLQLGHFLLQNIRSCSPNQGLLTPPSTPVPPNCFVLKPPSPTSSLDVKNSLPSFVGTLNVFLCLSTLLSNKKRCLLWCLFFVDVVDIHDSNMCWAVCLSNVLSTLNFICRSVEKNTLVSLSQTP